MKKKSIVRKQNKQKHLWQVFLSFSSIWLEIFRSRRSKISALGITMEYEKEMRAVLANPEDLWKVSVWITRDNCCVYLFAKV